MLSKCFSYLFVVSVSLVFVLSSFGCKGYKKMAAVVVRGERTGLCPTYYETLGRIKANQFLLTDLLHDFQYL